MRVLLTGAAGFIGSHVAESLCASGHEVVGVDRFDDYLYPLAVKRRNAEELARTLAGKSFSLHEMDICDRRALSAHLDESVDVVCHLAALAGVRPSLARPDLYMRTNLEGTINIFERAREVGVKRISFASSSSVYGAKGGSDLNTVRAFSEDDPCLTPASPYAASKRAGELLCSTYRDLYGMGFHALRFFTVYGPRQRPDMAIHKFAARIAEGVPISRFGDGSSRRDYTFIDDIVSGVVASIERVRPAQLELLNLGGTETTSLSELIQILQDVMGKKAIVEEKPMQPGDVPITYANVERAKALLDYDPKTSVRSGVERFWEWAKEGNLVVL
jgi:UDP-glucuronate 4-epimerase